MRKSQQSLAEIFGSHVFSDAIMRVRLPKNVYRALKQTMEEGRTLDASAAEVVASVMKDWAVELGATHFSHWFQPMTGWTAEKHDSFISPSADGNITLEFSGKELIKGESDASSFPSGGLRAVFEARGYTAWDVMSPAFVKEDASGTIALCIPTAFCSYNGEALDQKTPLLRSMEAVSREATRVLHLLGRTDVKRVYPTVGGEQEYFLVDKAQYLQRRDLMYAGRTMFGAPPPKGQELSDRYYAAIKPRVSAFMADLNEELWKLGVPAKTQHNEAAPAQHELASVFNTANIACDHNQLTMELMKKVADRHGLACLLHEKPFAGVNGSGKHDNWALSTDGGENLLAPDKHHPDDPVFWCFFLATIAAVDEYAPLLRQACASAGNEHRLGGHEAPPTVLSVFIGDHLAELYENMCQGEHIDEGVRSDMGLGVSTMPRLYRDDTDRNRSSPFAFTGNKFEFRMLGASQSLAEPNIVLNTIVAEMLSRLSDRIERLSEGQRESGVREILAGFARDHLRVVFNGNNYAPEWLEEAQRRGLPIIDSTVDAFSCLGSEAAVALFSKHGVLSRSELSSRMTIKMDNYAKTLRVEALTMIDMARQEFLPAISGYAAQVAQRCEAFTRAGVRCLADEVLLGSLMPDIQALSDAADALEAVVKLATRTEGSEAVARMYEAGVVPAMQELRAVVDRCEGVVERKAWPVPTYGDLFYSV